MKMLWSSVQYTGKLGVNKNNIGKKIYWRSTFTVSSREWLKDLTNIGYRNGKIPPIPEDLLHHYVRGYFDGDGSIYTEKKIKDHKAGFVFSNESLAKEMRQVILSRGIKTSNIHQKTNSKACFYFHLGPRQTDKLGDFMYKSSTLYLKRKYEHFKGLCACITKGG